MNVLGPQAPAVDEAGISLQQRRPCGDPVPGVVDGLDAADTDQRQPVTDPAMKPPQHLAGPGAYRWSAVILAIVKSPPFTMSTAEVGNQSRSAE